MLTAAIPASSASATAACSTRSRFRRHNHGLAIGYAGLRTLEAAVIAVGIVSLLAVVTLRQQASADAASLVGVGRGLVAVHNWTFLLGPNFKGFRTTSSDQRETARISYQVVG